MEVVQRQVINPFRKQFSKYINLLNPKSKSSKYIYEVANNQKKYLLLNIISGILNAFLEGLSLALVYLIVRIFSQSIANPFKWDDIFLVSSFPGISSWLSNLNITSTFLLIITTSLLVQLLQSFFKYINLLTLKYLEARCLGSITKKIYKQIFSFSYRCSMKYKTGDLSDYVSQSPETIRIQLESINDIIINVFVSFTYFLFIFNISNFTILFITFSFLILSRFLKKIFKSIINISHEVTKIKVSIVKIVVESFQGLRYIHSSGFIDNIEKEMDFKTISLENSLRTRARKLTLISPVISFFPIVFIFITSILLILTSREDLILPILSTFTLAIQRFNTSIIRISTSFAELSDNFSRLKRLDEIISDQNKEFLKLGGKNIYNKVTEITFSDLCFKYSKDSSFSIENLNLKMKPGTITALVGPSGSGKSTIVDLLLGLFQPDKGKILINNISLNDLNISHWQKKIGVIDQDLFLFNTSIKRNLTFGFSEIEFSEIKKACIDAGAHDFIENLPLGYETVLGERGFKLSGGQKQRIAIARALLRKGQILILDEATSALDSESENLIQKNIDKLKKRKIILIVAHRLSTIKNADNIIVLEKGKVSHCGSHKTLLKNCEIYKKLWKIQSFN